MRLAAWASGVFGVLLGLATVVALLMAIWAGPVAPWFLTALVAAVLTVIAGTAANEAYLQIRKRQ